MKANFGYKDGSGEFFIEVDTDLCTGCGDCVPACPAGILEMRENEYDPMAETQIAVVRETNRKTIKYDCAPCKGSGHPELPCVKACEPNAIRHSW